MTRADSVDRVLTRLDRRPVVTTFLMLAAIYLATTSWSLPYHIDALTNVLTAWKLGTAQTVILDEYNEVTGPEYYNIANQLVDTSRGPVSKYPPGAASLAAPLYSVISGRVPVTIEYFEQSGAERVAVIDNVILPQVWPGSVVAALSTALAMAAFTGVLSLWIGARWAWVGGLGLGLATSFWSVAADALWQHGPTALWLALAMLALTRHQPIWAGAAFGAAVITRPQVAVIAAVVGLGVAFAGRSVATLAKVGVPASLGMIGYIAYNRWAFSASIEFAAGGYWVEGTLSRPWGDTLMDLLRAFVDPARGMLIWSPILLVALFGLPLVWRQLPSLARAACLAGFVFLVIQVRGNGYSGGESFDWYRYQLEAIVMAAPALAISLKRVAETALGGRVAVAAAGMSVAVHAYAAVLL